MVKATRRDADESSVAVYSLSLLETSLESHVRRSIGYIQPLNDLRNFSYRSTRDSCQGLRWPAKCRQAKSNVERRNSNLEKRKRSNFGKTKRISTYVSLTPTASGSPAKNSLEKIPCRCQRSKLLPSSGLFPIIIEATTTTIRRANERIAFSDRCVQLETRRTTWLRER